MQHEPADEADRPMSRVSAAFLREHWANRPCGLMYRTIFFFTNSCEPELAHRLQTSRMRRNSTSLDSLDDVKRLPPDLLQIRSVSKTVNNFFHHCLHLQPKKSTTFYGHHLRCRCCFFWVVSASRSKKSCLQFLIPTAVFHMLLTRRY